MLDRFQILKHVWSKGHSIEVTKFINGLAYDGSRGWLYKCECGKKWSR